MARKIAILYWRIMVKGIDYVEKGISHYEEQILQQKIKTLNKLANELKVKIPENVKIA
jgi:hypothetical protein